VRVLNVIDEFTRVGLGSHSARAIGAKGVKPHLEDLFKKHGKPTLIRADNGREFIAETLLDWLGEQQVRGVFIAEASPWQNGINDRFNGTMERELGEIARKAPRRVRNSLDGIHTRTPVTTLRGIELSHGEPRRYRSNLGRATPVSACRRS
jgi:transposase InsO family protein